MLNHEDTVPWHKQPLVWMLILIPFSAVVVCAVLLYLSITTDDGLVADDYYKQGLAINRQIARDEVATQMQLAAEIEIDIAEGFVNARFNKGTMIDYPLQLQLVLKHAAAHQRDKYITLQHGIDDAYVGAIARDDKENYDVMINPGIWYVELSNAAGESETNWRIKQRVRLEGATRLMLQAE